MINNIAFNKSPTAVNQGDGAEAKEEQRLREVGQKIHNQMLKIAKTAIAARAGPRTRLATRDQTNEAGRAPPHLSPQLTLSRHATARLPPAPPTDAAEPISLRRWPTKKKYPPPSWALGLLPVEKALEKAQAKQSRQKDQWRHALRAVPDEQDEAAGGEGRIDPQLQDARWTDSHPTDGGIIRDLLAQQQVQQAQTSRRGGRRTRRRAKHIHKSRKRRRSKRKAKKHKGGNKRRRRRTRNRYKHKRRRTRSRR